MTTTVHKVKVQGYGWRPSLPDFRDHLYAPSPIKLPPHVDMRTTGLLPEVYDQGQLGSCTANASAAAMEYTAAVQGLDSPMPSRLFIYYNERDIEGTVNEDAGAELRDAVKVLNKFGVCPESEWPYDVSKFAAKPPAQDYRDGLGRRAIAYQSVAQTKTTIKTALAHNQPVIVGFSVYESFESQAVANTGVMPMPSAEEKLLGGHAVLVVGYKTINHKFHWIVRNSWGSGWGDGGYFYMPEKILTDPALSGDFWTLTIVGK